MPERIVMQLDLAPPKRKETGLVALIADLSIRNLPLATIRANYAQGDYKPASDAHCKGYVAMKYPGRK